MKSFDVTRWPLLAVILFVSASSWPLLTIRESFWIDELHSVWVVTGDWNQITQRSAIGNQSPLYFAALKIWYEFWLGLGRLSGTAFFEDSFMAEILLRIFSWIAWAGILLTIFCMAGRYREVLLTVVVWLVLDRQGAFYAIECRSYAWTAYFVLLMMLSAEPNESHALNSVCRQSCHLRWSWIICSLVAFYLHYTSSLAIVFSWLGMTLRSKSRSSTRRYALMVDNISSGSSSDTRWKKPWIYRLSEAFIFGVFALPGLYQLQAIGKNASQWSSFAGDSSFYRCATIIPWLSWIVVPVVAIIVVNFSSKKRFFMDSRTIPPFGSSNRQYLWVALGPLLMAWSLTFLQIAPLMHQRYLIGSYVACLFGGVLNLQRLSSTVAEVTGRFGRSVFWLLLVLCSAFSLGWSQQRLTEWKEGDFVSWQRCENWREVCKEFNRELSKGELVFVATMLVETVGESHNPNLPDDYLVCPLSTIYCLPKSRLKPLPNNSNVWPKLIYDSLKGYSKDHFSIVARGGMIDMPFETLQVEGEDGASGAWLREKTTWFGRLTVVRFTRVKEQIELNAKNYQESEN